MHKKPKTKLPNKKLTTSEKVIKLLPILLILLLGLLSLTWFKEGLFISGGDFFLAPMMKENAVRFLSSWDHLYATGIINTRIHAWTFVTVFLAIIDYLGLSPVTAQKIIFYSIFTGSGLSMFYLASSITKRKNNIICLSAALFYMFNFFALFSFWRQFTSLAFFYAIAPILLGLYIRILNKFDLKKTFLLLLIITIFFSIAAVNPAYVGILFFLLFSYFIFFIFVNFKDKQKIRFNLILNIFFVIFFVIFNLWWILPVIVNIKSEIAGATAIGGTMETLTTASTHSSFLNLYRLWGIWPFFSNNPAGEPYFSWAGIYFTSFFIIIGFIAPIVVFIACLSKKINKNFFYFATIFLLGLFLMKGMHSPLSGINKWIFLNVPFFEMYRHQYEKFGIIVCIGFAIILGMGMGRLFDYLKKFNRKIAPIFIISILILSFGIYMWPYWTGNIIYSEGKKTPSAHVKIPDYYFEAKEWLQTDSTEFKILSLPHQEGGSFDWQNGYYGSEYPTIHLFKRPILSPTINPNLISSYIGTTFNSFHKDKSLDITARLLGLGNTKYILVHNDLNYYFNTPNPQLDADYTKSVLDKQDNFSFEKAFGKIDFYKINDKYLLPHIYASTNPIYLKKNLEDNLLYFKNNLDNIDQEKPSVFFSENSTNGSKQKEIRSKINSKTDIPPEITFEEVSPTMQKVNVSRANGAYLLNFLDSYNTGWRVYILPKGDKNNFWQTWFKKSLPDNKHLKVNGFANSWLIEPSDANFQKNYDVIIEFWPQRIFYLGIFISGIALISCIGYLIIHGIKARNNNDKSD